MILLTADVNKRRLSPCRPDQPAETARLKFKQKNIKNITKYHVICLDKSYRIMVNARVPVSVDLVLV